MSTQPSTPNTLAVSALSEDAFRHQVYDLISRELGLPGYVRFLRTFCAGKGDYTAERHQWLDNVTLEDIARDLDLNPDVVQPSPSSTTPPK